MGLDAEREGKLNVGTIASPTPPGCRFHPRCPLALDICKRLEPAFEQKTADH
jgi:ABC-type dipeptide/oligopeptide/nickel transport system ATPase component